MYSRQLVMDCHRYGINPHGLTVEQLDRKLRVATNKEWGQFFTWAKRQKRAIVIVMDSWRHDTRALIYRDASGCRHWAYCDYKHITGHEIRAVAESSSEEFYAHLCRMITSPR